uniref:CSON012749 protein n=1 Tax=Culicoides sonorensis TaxID=179676 RepID=A0A336M6B4_CULSO
MYENGNNYDQEYMEQEEEWEREGLLDPAWEKQQKKSHLTTKFKVFRSSEPELKLKLSMSRAMITSGLHEKNAVKLI